MFILKTVARRDIPLKERKRITHDLYGIEKLLTKFEKSNNDNFKLCYLLNVFKDKRFNSEQVILISLLDSLYSHKRFITNQTYENFYKYPRFGENDYFYITIEQIERFLFPLDKDFVFKNKIKQTIQSLVKDGIVDEVKYALRKSKSFQFDYKYAYKINLSENLFKNFFLDRLVNGRKTKKMLEDEVNDNYGINKIYSNIKFKDFENIYRFLIENKNSNNYSVVYNDFFKTLKFYCSIVFEINRNIKNDIDLSNLGLPICMCSMENIINHYNIENKTLISCNQILASLQNMKLIYVIEHGYLYHSSTGGICGIPRCIIKYNDYDEYTNEKLKTYIKNKYCKSFKPRILSSPPELKTLFCKYAQINNGKTKNIDKIKFTYESLYDYYLHCLTLVEELKKDNISKIDKNNIINILMVAVRLKKDLTIFEQYDFYKGDVDLCSIENYLLTNNDI